MRSPSQSTAVALDSFPATADPSREFAFSEADFRFLVQLAYERAGIALADSKRNLVYSRLSRRLRVLGMASFRDYREFLSGSDGEREIESFINSISTNHTKFFRESHHLAHFRDNVAKTFAHDARGGRGRLRVWSAGCSTGEEPYSVALVLRKELPEITRHDVRILATDIDTEVIVKGGRGEYPATIVDEIPKAYHSYLQTVDADPDASRVVMNREIRSLVTFRQLNLMKPWPFNGPFDSIFCRNVMIYFDSTTKATLVERFTKMLKLGGWLYIGHSESLLGSHPGLQLMGRTIYRRQA